METAPRRSSGTRLLFAPSRRAPGRIGPTPLLLLLAAVLTGCHDNPLFSGVRPPSGRPAYSYAAVAVAQSVNCLLTHGGKARCWGTGPLGNGSAADSDYPVGVTGGIVFTELGLDATLRCGVSTNGVVSCWGTNSRGAFGNGTTESSDSPVDAVSTVRFASISVGGGVCGVSAEGAAYCWGANHDGELGIASDDTMRLVPTPVVGGLTFRRLARGSSQTCGVTTDGAAYCWGRHWGPTPQPVPTATRFSTIDGQWETFCGLTETGEVWCWGTNGDGQFGNGERDEAGGAYHTVPTPVVTDLRFLQIAVGAQHVCGIESVTEEAYCWGSDHVGQLGDGTPPGESGEVVALSPVRVRLAQRFSHIDVGFGTSCGTTVEGTAFCWGWRTADSTPVDAPEQVG